VAGRLAALAADQGTTAARLAIAWVLHQPRVAAVIAGASSVAQIEEQLAAADLALTPEDLAAITALAEEPEQRPA
jgi:aryl-alcohol dehydrogenase-like predicted oxidoreductase